VKVERNKATGYSGNIWESTEICGGKMGCQLEKTKEWQKNKASSFLS
jgi:hypothetical protein